MTRSGPLDLLGEIGKAKGYEEHLARSEDIHLGGGLTVRVLDLDALIEIKHEAGRGKDLAALPTLRSTLEEKRKK